MALNGNVIKGVITTLPPTVMIAILGFMGKGIVDNDRRNTNEHTNIRREVIQGDKEVHANIGRVKDIVTNIDKQQTEQRVIMQSQQRLLEKIEKKL